MRRLLCLFFLSGTLFAQQQVTPSDFNPDQVRLFKKVTEAVSTPCCQNGIPVAYHGSGMAEQVRDAVAKDIRAGKSEKEIMAALAKMTFGPNKDPLIFTVPDKDALGYLYWLLGPIMLVLLVWGMRLMLARDRERTGEVSDDALLEKYGATIDMNLEKLG